MRHGTGGIDAARDVRGGLDDRSVVPSERPTRGGFVPGPDGSGGLWTPDPNRAPVADGAPDPNRAPVADGAPGPTAAESPFSQPGLHQFADLSLGEIAERAGLKRIDVVAWRDFDDPEAGGSELHAHRVMAAWAKAGIDVSMTTSSVPDGPQAVRREGYGVVRRAGRYAVFPRVALLGARGKIGSGDGLVEIWNGMPFFSPLWAHSAHIVFLHHVHAEMWKMVLPSGLAESGYAIEHRLAPPVYRRTRIVTLSASSKREIVEQLRIPPTWCRSRHPVSSPSSRPGVSGRTPRWWWRSAGWCRSSGSTC